MEATSGVDTLQAALERFAASGAASQAGEPRRRRAEALGRVLADPAAYRFAVRLVRGAGPAAGQDVMSAGAPEHVYAYPASAVKLLAAVAALRVGGVSKALRSACTAALVPSDNGAYNALLRVCGGPAGVARRLRDGGLDGGGTRLSHALRPVASPDPHAELGASAGWEELVDDDSTGTEVDDGRYLVGKAHVDAQSGEVVEEPLDFRRKNRAPLTELQDALRMVVAPATSEELALLPPGERLFLAETLASYEPGKPPGWHKFFVPGLAGALGITDEEAKDRLRVYNKSGRAYGFTVDNALVSDPSTGQAFLLACTLYTNPNGVLNDDKYDYEPFADDVLAAVAEAVALWLGWGEAQPTGTSVSAA